MGTPGTMVNGEMVGQVGSAFPAPPGMTMPPPLMTLPVQPQPPSPFHPALQATAAALLEKATAPPATEPDLAQAASTPLPTRPSTTRDLRPSITPNLLAPATPPEITKAQGPAQVKEMVTRLNAALMTLDMAIQAQVPTEIIQPMQADIANQKAAQQAAFRAQCILSRRA